MTKYSVPHNLPIIEPAIDFVKSGSTVSALADHINALALVTNSGLSIEGARAESAAKSAAAADASAKDAAIDAKATSAVSTANNALTVSSGASSDADNAVDRVTALESAAGFGPSTPTDGTMADYIANPATLTSDAVDSSILAAISAGGAARNELVAAIGDELGTPGTPARLAGDAVYPLKSSAEIGMLGVGTGAGNPRSPFMTRMTADPTKAGTNDFSTHTLTTTINGDFTSTPSTNQGWLWGLNVYTTTGRGPDDARGIDHLTGALIEASIQSPAVTGNVIGLQAEAAFLGSSAGGTVGAMTSLKVAAPKRKDGATAGNATTVYGLYVDSVPAGALGSTNAYSLYVAGGRSRFAGDVFVGGNLSVGASTGLFVGQHKVYDKGTTIGFVSPADFEGNIIVRGSATILGTIAVEQLSRQTDSSYNLRWGSGIPEGNVAAAKGSLYFRTDGTAAETLYVKTAGSGTTGWVAK